MAGKDATILAGDDFIQSDGVMFVPFSDPWRIGYLRHLATTFSLGDSVITSACCYELSRCNQGRILWAQHLDL